MDLWLGYASLLHGTASLCTARQRSSYQSSASAISPPIPTLFARNAHLRQTFGQGRARYKKKKPFSGENGFAQKTGCYMLNVTIVLSFSLVESCVVVLLISSPL